MLSLYRRAALSAARPSVVSTGVAALRISPEVASSLTSFSSPRASARLLSSYAQQQRETDQACELYGPLPVNQSQTRSGHSYASITSLSPALVGRTVSFRARVAASRVYKTKVFLNLRQQCDSVQALLISDGDKVSKQMIDWVASLPDDCIVRVQGVVIATPEPVKSASVRDVEVHISKLHLISGIDGQLPFSLIDASRPDADFERPGSQFNRVHFDTRLNNRVVDLRTCTNQAVFKLQSGLGDLFRRFLSDRGFIEIHSPKLQAGATESGASVFKLDYFGGHAFLAQSPQLAKQMAIAADFERVYEVGPVFRAEDSHTHRHLTEFTGLDLEMTIEEHYHEVVDLLDELFKSVFRGLKEKFSREIEIVGRQFPAEEFKWREGPEGTVKLTFKEALDLLVEDGVPREGLDDISTENEKRLGQIVKAKWDTDYFIVDKFPSALRPFYTMPDFADPSLSNSYDFYMRGEEILSGAQRIHDPNLLLAKLREQGIDAKSMKSYIDGFRMGCSPHGGGGIGLERVLMLFLKLGNIRRASLFPRDPKRLEP